MYHDEEVNTAVVVFALSVFKSFTCLLGTYLLERLDVALFEDKRLNVVYLL